MLNRLRFLILLVLVLLLETGTALAADTRFSRANLDTTCKPCQDFYQFATGGWRSQNPIPAAYPSWGSFNVLDQRNKQMLRDILETAARQKSTPGTNVQKIGDYYTSCMNTSQIDALGTQPLQEDLSAIDQIQTLSELQATVARLQRRGVSPLLGFGSSPDARNSQETIAEAAQSGLGLPDRDYYLKSDDRLRKTRQEYVKHVARMFALLGESGDTNAKTVLAVETKLAEASLDKVQLRDPIKTYNKLDREQVQQLTQNFSWQQYFQDLGKPNISAINIATPEYFKHLDRLLTTTPLADWKTYLRWQLIHARSPRLASAFDTENFNFYSRYLQGSREQRPRWQRCVSAVNGAIGEVLGEVYVKKAFPLTAKARINTLIDNIITVYRDKIKTLDWMSDATKQEALTKLNAMGRKIGYPDRWRDYSRLNVDRTSYLANVIRAEEFEFQRDLDKIGKPVDRSEWGMTPPTVNAYYNPLMNEIAFPAGILQPPFFDFKADDAINYGAIGAVIGHEISHGFDDQGRQFDAMGNLRDWWKPEDAEAYKSRAICVVNQASGFKLTDGKSQEALSINGQLTLGENIADLVGLTLSHAALERSLQGKPQPAKIDGFTAEQRFFLGYAQVWSTNYRPEFLRQLLQVDVHAPAPFRVNAPLSNLTEFTSAFGCKQTEVMTRSPKQQCRIW